ncbi:MAG: phosphotransferase [Deltaproteobacteria bacterium]|nr:phosphotransferase [Deltaproteobacteria bacterium]MCB9785448.1 phosphotransferase [Deltaproteobacteria bacterium]
MRLSELRAREDLDAILQRTLARDFSERLGQPVTVTAGGSGQRWLVQPTLSAFYTRGICAAARRHLRDDFRWTPVRRRIPAQFALGTALASGPGLRLFGRPGFTVDPPLPAADALVVVPGNRRVRLFDFERGVCRVLLKDGFPARVMETEVAMRGRPAEGPFPPITALAPDLSWFEEPLLQGCVVPRLPPWVDAAPLVQRALDALGRHVAPSAREVDASAHLESLLARVALAHAEVATRYGADAALPAAFAAPLADVAALASSLEVALSHGDLQPGNIFVTAGPGEVLLIDWEHAGTRLRAYDALVLGLGSRSARGLARRVTEFVSGRRTVAGLGPEAADIRWRRATVAAFLLEDLTFYLEESVEVPGARASAGLAVLDRELQRLGPGLAALRERAS